MREWLNARCACEDRSCSDLKAAFLALPALATLVASFWSINLF
jgi:hypothetical protein